MADDTPSLLDNYQGDYKTIDDASAAIKNGTFGAANPYTPGSDNYNNYANPGEFGTQKTYPMVQWSAGGLGGAGTQTYEQQLARDTQQRAFNGASNSGNTDLTRNIIGGTPTATPDNSTPFSNAMGVQPSANQGLGTQSDGTLQMNINGQPSSDVKVFQGTAFESARDMANQLGLPYSADPKTGEISIGGVKVSPTSYDKNGEAIVGVRNVADALGYKVDYNDSSKMITVTKTGNPKDTPTTPGLITGNQIPTGNSTTPTTFTNTGLITGNQIPTAHGSQVQQTNPNGLPTIPQQTPIQPWQQPDLSSYQNNMMPYGTFNNDMSQYYNQAQSSLQPTFDVNSQKLMDKQNTDLANQDVNMNRRGIYTSGIAEAAANDLRAKTSNAIANSFTAQMAQVQKTAQTLYNDAFKQYQDGNTFALKYNQDQVTNMLNVEKQSFSQYISTQKLNQTQFSDALKSWDQVATLIQKDAQFQQTNALDNMKALLPYQNQTMDNKANNATSANNNINTNATSIANNTANNNLKYSQMMGFNANGVPTLETFKLLGYIPMPDGTLVPTEQANNNSRTYALNLAKELGYVTAPDGSLVPTEQSRHNMATEDLTASGQAVSAANNAANNATSAANNAANNTTSAANNAANNATSAANNANKPKSIDSKGSYNQSESIKTQLNNSKVKIDNSTAKKFIDANKDVLTDSDYRDLNAWADSKYK